MQTEVLIIGGGLAGAAAATHLARAGRSVLLVERASQPQHKVCGEFLSAEALLYLEALGIRPASLGAVPISQVRLLHRNRDRCTRLPFAAMSVSRRCLDEALLKNAEAAGARVLRGTAIGHLDRPGEMWNATTEGETFEAKTVFLATGKHDLHNFSRPAGVQRGLTGVKMYLRLESQQTRALEGTVELITFPGGYGGLQLVEEGMANLCCLVPTAFLRQSGEALWPRLQAMLIAVSPHLAARLYGAEALLARPLAVTPIPYGFVRRDALAEGMFALGDQAAVIPSFTGDGMSIALHSAALAARMYRQGESVNLFQQRLHRELQRQVSVATALSLALVRFPGVAMSAAMLCPSGLSTIAQHTRIAADHLLLDA